MSNVKWIVFLEGARTRWKLDQRTSPIMLLSALFEGMMGQVDRSCSGFADDLFIKNDLPDHTAESARDITFESWRSYPAY